DQGTVEAAGTDADLKTLVQSAANDIYAQTQPYRYGIWLTLQNRFPEARVVFQKLVDDGPPNELVWGLHGLSFTADFFARMAFLQRELPLSPDFAPALALGSNTKKWIGDPENSMAFSRRILGSNEPHRYDDLAPGQREAYEAGAHHNIADILGDYAAAGQH